MNCMKEKHESADYQTDILLCIEVPNIITHFLPTKLERRQLALLLNQPFYAVQNKIKCLSLNIMS